MVTFNILIFNINSFLWTAGFQAAAIASRESCCQGLSSEYVNAQQQWANHQQMPS